MDLKSRLSRLQGQAGSGQSAAAAAPPAADLRGRLAQLRPGRQQAGTTARAAMSLQELAQRLDAEVLADGVLRLQANIPLEGPAAGRGRGAVLPALQPLCAQPRLPGEAGGHGQRNVYLDTETTGLSGGSGTLAFLVGMAVVSADTLELTQFLLTRFAAEAALLAALAAAITPADRLVSYNGKSYDLPLLASRFRMQGLAQPLAALPHLDLLHPVRRLFGAHWADCRLQTLEQRLLGFTRSDDLPGSEAPAAWFAFIRGGEGEQLLRVVAHNRQDIVSLAAAHAALARAVHDPPACGVDLAALARWLAESDEAAARALLLAHQESLCVAGKRLLGRLSRRAGNWQQAVRVWESLAAAGCTEALEGLAKYHEHVSKDLHAARRCCERLPGGPAQRRRHERLARKLLGRGAPPGCRELF